jgi:hypothetical protein
MGNDYPVFEKNVKNDRRKTKSGSAATGLKEREL